MCHRLLAGIAKTLANSWLALVTVLLCREQVCGINNCKLFEKVVMFNSVWPFLIEMRHRYQPDHGNFTRVSRCGLCICGLLGYSTVQLWTALVQNRKLFHAVRMGYRVQFSFHPSSLKCAIDNWPDHGLKLYKMSWCVFVKCAAFLARVLLSCGQHWCKIILCCSDGLSCPIQFHPSSLKDVIDYYHGNLTEYHAVSFWICGLFCLECGLAVANFDAKSCKYYFKLFKLLIFCDPATTEGRGRTIRGGLSQ